MFVMMDDKLATRMNLLEESATLALNAKAKTMIRDGRTIYNLTIGELPCDTPQYIVDYVGRKLHNNKYTPADGLVELRELVAEQTKKFYALDWISPANVVVTSSVKPGLYTSMLALLNPGDEVILPSPYWLSYKYEVMLAGAEPVDVALDSNFDLDIKNIERAITSKTKAIILSSPGNPTSATYSAEALEKLTKLLNQKKIWALIDDIYCKLVFDQDFKPVPSYGFEKMVILGGFSKSQALTGWRIGYVIAAELVAKAVANIQSHMIGNASVPAQFAAIAALKAGDRPVMLNELKRNCDFLVEKIAPIKNISLKKPDGAFYGFLDIRQITHDSQSWCEQLLEQTGVATVPGEAFFSPGFVRLNFAADQKILGPALELIASFASKKDWQSNA
jgi:aspartate aminotransferase